MTTSTSLRGDGHLANSSHCANGSRSFTASSEDALRSSSLAEVYDQKAFVGVIAHLLNVGQMESPLAGNGHDAEGTMSFADMFDGFMHVDSARCVPSTCIRAVTKSSVRALAHSMHSQSSLSSTFERVYTPIGFLIPQFP